MSRLAPIKLIRVIVDAQNGRTALMHAVMGDKTEAFTALLAAHADIEAKDKVRSVHSLAAQCDLLSRWCAWGML